MMRGVTYTFDQLDVSNWYHPVGFAYFADGAHRDVDELEPGISQSGSSCVDSMTCQAPRYFRNGEFVGVEYDNVEGVGGEDFGLDVYEPDFFLTREAWSENQYVIELTLTDMDYDADIFYFCHVHNEMSGRIKVLDEDGVPVSAADEPEIPYEYYVPSAYDAACGTTGTEPFRESAGVCAHDMMFCPSGNETEEVSEFIDCMYALDCQMDFQMRVNVHPTDPIKLFMDQMIPHHENAVNMAKTLLIRNFDLDADVTDMLWNIINTQNFQINTMQTWLESNGYATDADACPLLKDSSSWFKMGEPSKNCAWVAAFVPTRCAVKGFDKTTAWDSCK